MKRKWITIIYALLFFVILSRCSTPAENLTIENKPPIVTSESTDKNNSTPTPLPEEYIFQDTPEGRYRSSSLMAVAPVI